MKSAATAVLFILFLCATLFAGAQNQPRFTENKGQLPEQVEYSLRVSNADVFFEKDRLRFNFYNPELLNTHDHEHEHHSEHESEYTNHAYDVRFVACSDDATTESE